MGQLANPVVKARFKTVRAADQRQRGTVRQLRVQRRLSEPEIRELVRRYLAGETVVLLATAFGLHRTTVLEHLERRGVPRRQMTAKLSTAQIERAMARYQAGSSVKDLAAEFDVSPETMRMALVAAGVTMRPKGRPPVS